MLNRCSSVTLKILAKDLVTYRSKPFVSCPAYRVLGRHLSTIYGEEYRLPNHVGHFWSIGNNT